MLRRRPGWLDIAITLPLVVISIVGTAGAHHQQGMVATRPAYLLAVLAALPLLVQRVVPLWTFAITGGLAVAYLGLHYAYGPILLSLAVAIANAGLRVRLRTMLIAMAILLAGLETVIGVGVLAGTRGPEELLSSTVWFLIPAAIGITIKARRDAQSDVRTEQARRAVSEERLRLAQEVHDVAGHGFAVIAMQAGVALRVLDRDVAAARAALEGIRAASREALDGLRAEVEAMRSDAPLRPTTGLADLPGLAERLRSSGLPVALTLDAVDVPPEVDRAAYRIVQESLTNVLRHAGPGATATVHIGREDGVLRLDVTDTGPPSTIRPGGRGIDGMRGRAESVGGTLDAGPQPAGGFAVRATLPLATPPGSAPVPPARPNGGDA